MSRTVRVTVVGDYNPENRTHTATTNALRHAARGIGIALDLQWAHTSRIDPEKPGKELDKSEGIFLAPASPYASMAGALATVRYAREQGRPFAAT